MNLSSNSKFWLPAYWEPSDDPIQLAIYQRVVTNFIRITTGREDIEVKYIVSTESFTNGKTVWLSSKVPLTEIDVCVGLALHEASHIVYTNFEYLNDVQKMETNNVLKTLRLWLYNNLKQEYDFDALYEDLHILINWIEDRRIDALTMQVAPGYSGYYDALYQKYFCCLIIDEVLLSRTKNQLTFDDYLFHIINFINPNRTLDILPGLEDIWNLIDMKNILRLQGTPSVTAIAVSVIKLIYSNITLNSANNPPQNKTNHKKDSDLRKQLEKQIELIDGKVSKDTITIEVLEKINAAQKISYEIKSVGQDNSIKVFHNNINHITKCFTATGLSNQIIQSKLFRHHIVDKKNTSFLKNGLRIGNLLSKKLQTRNESREIITTRQKYGKLDKRLISSIGYDRDDVYEHRNIESLTPIFVHLSIDASGSMSGEKWTEMMSLVVAIAKSLSLIDNTHCVISLRGTHNLGRENVPLQWIIYDSSIHKNINIHIKLFENLIPNGPTPEGLCYEAELDSIKKMSNGKDSYFISFSDGVPHFSNYSGTYAHLHTAKQVKKMIHNNINVLAFFICNDAKNSDEPAFRKMYGNNAKVVKTTELSKLTKQLNNLFIRQ